MKPKIILVVDEDFDEARESSAIVNELLTKRGFSVKPVILNELLLTNCLNWLPEAAFFKRNLVFKGRDNNLIWFIKDKLGIKIYLFDDKEDLKNLALGFKLKGEVG